MNRSVTDQEMRSVQNRADTASGTSVERNRSGNALGPELSWSAMREAVRA